VDGQLAWVVFVAVLGACVGSFLNVVIYRLPRGLSIRRPARSFCPQCARPIAWYDNIPLVSYLLLAGRCRHCRGPISIRYPIIEALTAMVFVVTFDGFFIGRVRQGLGDVGHDWPVLLAHLGLLAGLLALSVIDLEHYWVDVRITWCITALGLAAYAIWFPGRQGGWPQPGDATAAAAVGAAIGLVLVGWFERVRASRQAAAEASEERAPSDSAAGPDPDDPTSASSGQSPRHGTPVVALASLAALVVLVAMVLIGRSVPVGAPAFAARAGLVVVACFVALLAGSVVPRASDRQIVEAIDQERPIARRQVARELLGLTGPVVLGATAAAAVTWSPTLGRAWSAALGWSPLGGVQPIGGCAAAVTGLILAGAIGWVVRIVFTLWLGREAFGFGDVHLMASAGAVAGWGVVLLGFFAGCVLALFGLAGLLLVKRSRAIPFGPWLSLGVLIMIFARDGVVRFLEPGLSGLRLLWTAGSPG